MAGNVKALTTQELAYVAERYSFEAVGGYVAVKVGAKKTLHDKAGGFSLLLPLERRRIKISPMAIDLWEESFRKGYSLIEVQNAINALLVALQKPTKGAIKEQLRRERSRLDNILKKGEI